MSWDGQGCSAFRTEWARTGSKKFALSVPEWKVTRRTTLTRIKSAIWKDLSQTFLVPAFLSGSQNVLPLNPRAAFLQTQSKKQKTDILSSVLLSDHITQQRRCAPSHQSSRSISFVMWPDVKGIHHGAWFVWGFSLSLRKRSLHTLFSCPSYNWNIPGQGVILILHS